MKSSAREHKSGRYAKCLLVDGYNLLPKLYSRGLHEIADLSSARLELADWLGEYRAFAGEDVVLVFDAHHTDSGRIEEKRAGITIVFTSKRETADERIESLVYEYRNVYGQITVATSDFVEQQVVFGGGALRISSSELARRLREARKSIRQHLPQAEEGPKSPVSDRIRQDIAKILEKWRRQP